MFQYTPKHHQLQWLSNIAYYGPFATGEVTGVGPTERLAVLNLVHSSRNAEVQLKYNFDNVPLVFCFSSFIFLSVKIHVFKKSGNRYAMAKHI